MARREKFSHDTVRQTGPERQDVASHLKAHQASCVTNISDGTGDLSGRPRLPDKHH